LTQTQGEIYKRPPAPCRWSPIQKFFHKLGVSCQLNSKKKLAKIIQKKLVQNLFSFNMFPDGAHDARHKKTKKQKMKKAINIETASRIKFKYLKPDAEKPRTYTLTSNGGAQPAPLLSWTKEVEGVEITYFKGWCIERQAPRVLRSDRVISYEVTSK